MTESTRVLFIAGGGRSGSTILHNMLGQVEGFVAVGELRDLWQRGALANWSCGCGLPFGECDMWTQALGRAGLNTPEIAREMSEATESFRIKDLPSVTLPPIRRRRLAELGSHRIRLGRLYAAIADVTGARVIVDSSKNPSYGFLLRHVPNLDVVFLHFVRDSPAVAFSWSRSKMFEPGRPMQRKSTMKSALQWDARNAATELFLPHDPARRMRVRYEDLVGDPRPIMSEIVQWAGGGQANLPFISDDVVVLDEPNHSVFGNAVRFERGPVRLERDDRWRDQMAPRDVRTVKAITWPLRHRYGYTQGTHDGPVREVRA